MIDWFDEMFDLITAKPFRPFRVRMQDGSEHEIVNEDYAGVSVSQIHLHSRAQPGARREWRRYPLAEIAAVELLTPAAAGR